MLFTYRTFNGFLLGYLLLETSAMALRDPKPGDGSFTGTDTASNEDIEPAGQAAANPVPGGLSPARSPDQREAVEDASRPRELVDPAGDIDARRFPTVHRLAAGLAQHRWEEEFETGLVAHARPHCDGRGRRAGPQARLMRKPRPWLTAPPARSGHARQDSGGRRARGESGQTCSNHPRSDA